MMTRTDYVIVAEALARRMRFAATEADRWQVEAVARELATALAARNPRFDRARFLSTAGVHHPGLRVS